MSDGLKDALEDAQHFLPRIAYATILGEIRRSQGIDRLRNRGVENWFADRVEELEAMTQGEKLLAEGLKEKARHRYTHSLSATGAPGETVVNALVQTAGSGVYDLALRSKDGSQYAGTVFDSRDFLPGDVVAYALESQRILGHSLRFAPDTVMDVVRASKEVDTRPSLGFHGPETAKVLFMGERPQAVEIARREALVGDDGAYFREKYLKPLGLKKDEVAFGFVCPMAKGDTASWGQWMAENLAKYKDATIVTLGKAAKREVGEVASESLPHPSAVRKSGRLDEVKRKLRRLKSTIEDRAQAPQEQADNRPLAERLGETVEAEIVSAERNRGEFKRIVTGIILNPNRLDSYNTWWPPALVESMAHGYLANSGVVGNQHREFAEGTVVESSIEFYPSPENRALAHSMQDHTIWSRPYGRGLISSGCWSGSTMLGEEEWDMVLSGEKTGFSVGALARQGQASKKIMPKIITIDLAP